MREAIFDAGVLRAVAFTMPGGLPWLLAAVGAPRARVPPEVYNGNDSAPLPAEDVALSVLARDIRALRRRVERRHWSKSQWERASLRNADRLAGYLANRSLIVDALNVEELPRRESLRDRYGIGRGEAASLVLAERSGADVVFLAPEGLAYDAAQREGVRSVAVRDAVAA